MILSLLFIILLSIAIPVLKTSTDKILLNSYRPMSLNTCICKVLEKIIATSLRWFLNSNNLIIVYLDSLKALPS